MDLIEIDHIDREAAEAVLDFATDRIRAQYLLYLTLGTPAQPALGEDVRLRTAPLLQRSADDFLRVSQSVNGGRVDPVNAEFERAVNGRNGIVVVLRSPGELPARAADGPGSIAYGSDVQVGIAKLACLHFDLLRNFLFLMAEVHLRFQTFVALEQFDLIVLLHSFMCASAQNSAGFRPD